MKRRFKKYEDCEAAYVQADRQSTIFQICLLEATRPKGDVTWFKGKIYGAIRGASDPIRLGLVRPDSASGGLVIMDCYGVVNANYLDQFVKEANEAAQAGNYSYQSILPLIEKVVKERNRRMDLAYPKI